MFIFFFQQQEISKIKLYYFFWHYFITSNLLISKLIFIISSFFLQNCSFFFIWLDNLQRLTHMLYLLNLFFQFQSCLFFMIEMLLEDWDFRCFRNFTVDWTCNRIGISSISQLWCLRSCPRDHTSCVVFVQIFLLSIHFQRFFFFINCFLNKFLDIKRYFFSLFININAIFFIPENTLFSQLRMDYLHYYVSSRNIVYLLMVCLFLLLQSIFILFNFFIFQL